MNKGTEWLLVWGRGLSLSHKLLDEFHLDLQRHLSKQLPTLHTQETPVR